MSEWARPTGRGVAENVIANAVIAIPGAMIAGISAALTWWADPNITRAGAVLYAVGLAVLLSLVFLICAIAWRRLYPLSTVAEGNVLPTGTSKEFAGSKDERPIGTHPADVEDKLLAIKDVLSYVRGPALDVDKSLVIATVDWRKVKSVEEAKEFAIKSGKIIERHYECHSGLRELSQRYREFDHISHLLNLEPDREPLNNLVGNLVNAIIETRNHVIIEPFASALKEWTDKWRRWRNNTENELIALKRELSR